MSVNRIKLTGSGHYHIYSRLVLGEFLLAERKVLPQITKALFRAILLQYFAKYVDIFKISSHISSASPLRQGLVLLLIDHSGRMVPQSEGAVALRSLVALANTLHFALSYPIFAYSLTFQLPHFFLLVREQKSPKYEPAVDVVMSCATEFNFRKSYNFVRNVLKMAKL